jgi:hypothetical protein
LLNLLQAPFWQAIPDIGQTEVAGGRTKIYKKL